MPNIILQSLINKLRNLRDKSQNSSNFLYNNNEVIIERKEKEILSRVNLINYNKISLRTIAIYFINTNLNKFTVDELKLLLKIDFSDLDNNSIESNNSFEFDIANPPIETSNKCFKLEQPEFKIEQTHSKLLSVNKNKSFSFFINYIISKL